MRIQFHKMHGALNDFVVFHDPNGEVRLSAEQVAFICNRRAGIGADGVIVVRPSEKADFFMDYINADGSLAEMCGNGIRCLAKYVYDNGLTTKTSLNIETRAGIRGVELLPGKDGKIDKVRVSMGEPIFDPERIPVNISRKSLPVLDYNIETQDRVFEAALLSMGNPHCVIFVDEDPDPLPRKYGPGIENYSIFPAKTNVEFVRVIDSKRLVMRVWERGSGETFSCGTGACAVVVAATLKGLVTCPTVVDLLGGELEIEWKGLHYSVIMTGTSTLAFNGIIII